MPKIALMTAELANLIAAGEVIERPSSVVKELVENAIDAHASHIEITVLKAGREKIVVKDDGSGMDETDAGMAFLRHASSKVKNQYDLMGIRTLGFRGEALPSIAAVSKVELLTSTGEKGTRVFLEPDHDPVIEDAPARRGSVFTVSDLFYNTPARLKYLKSDRTETSDTIEKVEHLALGFPEIAFTLTVEGRTVLKTSGRGDLLECIAAVYGPETARKMIKVEGSTTLFKIGGYIAPPQISYATRYDVLTFINRRSVYISRAQKAVLDSYRDYLPPTRFPLTVLYIEADRALVDVNVHPSKKEVRLSSEEELDNLLKDTVRRALLSSRPSYTEVSGPRAVTVEFRAPEPTPSIPVPPAESRSASIPTFEEGAIATEELQELPSPEQLFTEEEKPTTGLPDLTPIGQILDTYIVCDGPDGLYLVDQHAAAERINYEKYEREFSSSTETMAPLFPLMIEVPPSILTNFDVAHAAALAALGIEAAPFGGNTLRIERIPLCLQDEDDRSVLIDIVTECLNDRRPDLVSLKKLAIATKACKASVRANAHLSPESQRALLRELNKCRNPANCPHGRPTVVKISRHEIEKLFKRTGF